MARALVSSFNAGEVSPFIDARSDVEKYASSCREVRNFLPIVQGAARYRPGFRWVAAAKGESRLLPFRFSAFTSYVIESGNEYMRFHRARFHYQVQKDGAAYEIASPYSLAQIDAVQFAQIKDTIYMTHREVAPQKLSRIAEDEWEIEEVPWQTPPLLDPNPDDDVKLTPSGTEGNITIAASADVFEEGNVGGYYQIGHRRESDVEEIADLDGGTIDVEQFSPAIEFVGDYEVNTSGNWSGDLIVQRSLDEGVTYTQVGAVISSRNDHNVNLAVTNERRGLFRLRYIRKDDSAGGEPPRAWIQANESILRGLVRITGFTDAQNVTAEVIDDLESTDSTDIWTEGAFSNRRGFPKAVTFHEGRLLYGGSEDQPQRWWASKNDDFSEFNPQNTATGAYSYTIASGNGNSIEWMASKDDLLMGTTGGEVVITAQNSGSVSAENNPKVRNPTGFGSAQLSGVLAGDALIYIGRGAESLREFAILETVEKYKSPELSVLAEHLVRPEIRGYTVQGGKGSTAWIHMQDGSAAAMLYNREQGVVAWSSHTTPGGEFRSFAATYGERDDETWAVIKRGESYTIEVLDPDTWKAQDNRQQSGCLHLDCGVTRATEADNITVTGLEHLEGQTVQVVADGAQFRDNVVVNGQITLELEATTVNVGLHYGGRLTPHALAIAGADGSMMGKPVGVSECALRLYRTLDGIVETPDGRSKELIVVRNYNTNMDAPPEFFDGVKQVDIAGILEVDALISIVAKTPLPLNILNMETVVSIHGR